MKSKFMTLIAAAALISLLATSAMAITPYSEDFESLDASNPAALGDAGWLIFANVFAPDFSYLYGYGVFPAPNDGGGFCVVATGEGGAAQGEQQLNVFSDYNNEDHANGNWIEANVFQEMSIDAENVGENWIFEFDAKLGNLEGQTTAIAFIKTLDPNNGFATTNFITADMTAISTTWGSYGLSLEIDAGLVGQLFQIGFSSTATNYEGSGVFYDNVELYVEGSVATAAKSLSDVKAQF